MITPLFRRTHPLVALFFRALVRAFAPRFRVSGRHHLPRRGPVIFVSNHLSDVDPPFLGAAIRFPVAWMAKRELWQIGWLSPVLDFVGCFPVDPGSPDRAALKKGLEVLKQGDGLVVFAEGRISPSGELEEILPGALLLALKSGATLIPVGLCNTQKVGVYAEPRPRFTLEPVRVHFGAPLRFDDLHSQSSRRAREIGTQRLEKALRQAIHTARTS